MAKLTWLLATLPSLVQCMPGAVKPRAALPPKVQVNYFGTTTSTNFPNTYRDGGGGGKINGYNFIMFSDGIYTSGGTPVFGQNWVNFTSNSIACSNCDGKGVKSLSDFGNIQKGPLQTIPYFYNNGENDGDNAIWPQQNMAALCGGACGVSFPMVVDRNALRRGEDGDLYNTGVEISLTGFGPIARRPTQAIFRKGEPMFGSFSNYAGIDGYLYMFAKITHTAKSNGLKVARVPQSSWSTRSQYQFWNGRAWVSQIPAYDDGGVANIFNYTQTPFGGSFGPGTGEIFWSPYYNAYLLLFQADNAALDPTVWLSYTTSGDFSRGWTTPQAIYTLPVTSGGYSYSFHSYFDYDTSGTGKVIPLSWTQFAGNDAYYTAFANLTFV